jgi:hypothetical protein
MALQTPDVRRQLNVPEILFPSKPGQRRPEMNSMVHCGPCALSPARVIRNLREMEIVEVPAAALDAAVNSTCSEPASAMEKAAGEAVTPVGSPLMVADTLPENPFTGETVTVTVCVPPEATDRD